MKEDLLSVICNQAVGSMSENSSRDDGCEGDKVE